jgi:hypothetical protein
VKDGKNHLPQGCQMVCFQTKKSQFWVNFEGFGMEKVCIFFGHLEYIKAILNILGPFDNLVAIWYIFPRYGKLCQEKSGIPDLPPFVRDMCICN